MRVATTFLTPDMRLLVLKTSRERHALSHLPMTPPPHSSPSLRKVTLMEDRDSVIHLRNLSLHPATNEEEGGCDL